MLDHSLRDDPVGVIVARFPTGSWLGIAAGGRPVRMDELGARPWQRYLNGKNPFRTEPRREGSTCDKR